MNNLEKLTKKLILLRNSWTMKSRHTLAMWLNNRNECLSALSQATELCQYPSEVRIVPKINTNFKLGSISNTTAVAAKLPMQRSTDTMLVTDFGSYRKLQKMANTEPDAASTRNTSSSCSSGRRINTIMQMPNACSDSKIMT